MSARETSPLYDRIAAAMKDCPPPSGKFEASGFSNTLNPDADPARWAPVGRLHERYLDRNAEAKRATFRVIGGIGVLGVRGGGASNRWEQRAIANTLQTLTLVLDGQHAIDCAYWYDGREGWTHIRVELPGGVLPRAAEIELQGTMVFSDRLADHLPLPNYFARVYCVYADGLVAGWAGAAPGATDDVPVLVSACGIEECVMTVEPVIPGNPRVFRHDIARFCAEGEVTKVSVRSFVTGEHMTRSPIGVFRSRGRFFLLAAPKIEGGIFQMTLVSDPIEKGSYPLTLVRENAGGLETLCVADGPDEPGFKFGHQGSNTIRLPVDLVDGRAAILDGGRTLLGHLPPIEKILKAMDDNSMAADFQPVVLSRNSVEKALTD